MCVRRFISEMAALAALVTGLSCTAPKSGTNEPCTVAVLDAGSGLAQVAARGGRALAFDLGPADSAGRWRSDLATLGNPAIEAIVISNTGINHAGAAQFLDPALPFTGRVVVSPYADTAALRAGFGGWSGRIFFSVKSRGDTLDAIGGVGIKCLWPPATPDSTVPPAADVAAHYSMVFRLCFDESSALLSSDIDSAAQHWLAAADAWLLSSEVLVVPDHGSAGSIDQAFYGYVNPRLAIISCAATDPPATAIFDLFFQMGVAYRATDESGDIVGESNGFYWTWR